MSKNFTEYLQHILAECDYIISVITPTSRKDHFLGDETLKRAIVRSLEIIGEASKKIPVDVKLKWDKIAWKYMAGMRDRLIHDYMGVNYHIVWDVSSNIIRISENRLLQFCTKKGNDFCLVFWGRQNGLPFLLKTNIIEQTTKS